MFGQRTRMKTLERRHEDLLVAAAQRPVSTPTGSPSLLVRTAAGNAYPSTSQGYFTCTILELGGSEAEGSSGTLTETESTIVALNTGAVRPPIGTMVIATLVSGGRWAFHYDG